MIFQSESPLPLDREFKSTQDMSSMSEKDVNHSSHSDSGAVRLATSGSYVARPNQVTTVMLHGVPIVCLYIDGKERLCLAQISNTLLKQYSYNEIHNRRVALGITCVQCTPVQLEILRRAGAMPISSRRCGMITMREAQRLVKSFLEENAPPKLPENFSFHVKHECGWGCEGNFEPSRYNSSRAKCIKCTMCNMYFSPNKFIFHFHRTPESKYNHPDAANFNSWRRHLHLASDRENDAITHAWEDVKAMFNGGSRKRIMSTGKASTFDTPLSNVSMAKKQRIASPDYELSDNMYSSPYTAFTLLSQPRKPFQFSQLSHSHPMGFGLPFKKDCTPESPKSSPLQSPSWAGLHSMLPAYNLLWNTPFSHDYRSHMRNSVFPIREPASKNIVDSGEHYHEEDSSSSAGNSPTYDEKNERFSAFRLVSKSKSIEEKPTFVDSRDDNTDENEEVDITNDATDDEFKSSAEIPEIDKHDTRQSDDCVISGGESEEIDKCITCVDKVKHGIKQVLESSVQKVQNNNQRNISPYRTLF